MPAALHRPQGWTPAYPNGRYGITVSGIPSGAQASYLTLNKSTNPDGAWIAMCYLTGRSDQVAAMHPPAGSIISVSAPLPPSGGFAYGYGLHDWRYQAANGVRLAISPSFTVLAPLLTADGAEITSLGSAVSALEQTIEELADQFTAIAGTIAAITGASTVSQIGAAIANLNTQIAATNAVTGKIATNLMRIRSHARIT